jgi:hypothetical protein
MSDASLPSYRRIARMDEAFPGQLVALKPALAGLVPDEVNFTEGSYDELFVLLAAALYYVRDTQLRHESANRSGGNPKLVKMMMDEGVKDKDAKLAEQVLDRIAPYVPPKVLLHTLATMYANKTTAFVEYHGAIARIMADLHRIAAGFDPAEACPKALVRWASGPARAILYQELMGH